MRFKARLFSTQEPASDSSMIPARIAEEFFASEKFKQALEDRRLFGTLTHAARNLQTAKNYTPALAKTIGKDDQLLEDRPMTHILTKAWLDADGWAYGEFEVLDKTLADDIAVQKIKRLEFLLANRCKIGISCVIVGYWNSKDGHDFLARMLELKGADLTCCPSWRQAGIVDIDLENGDKEKTFSELDNEFVYDPKDYEDNTIKVKLFSTKEIDAPKSSKIDGKFTTLKAKCFSFNGEVIEMDPVELGIADEEQKEFTQADEVEEQKEFTQARVREELREMKLGLRMSFRRCLLSYRQAIKSMGGVDKIDPEDVKILKSMLNSEVLMILNQCTEAVIAGKQINTLLGTSAISKNLRVAGQALQMPLRMAHLEARRQGFVSKMRYQKLQAAYIDFSKAVIEEVFGPNSENMNLGEENENEGEE